MQKAYCQVDCSQSSICPRDHRDIVRLTVNGGLLDFEMYRGAGVGDYSRFDTRARWQPVTQSPRSRQSYGKIGDCEKSNCQVLPVYLKMKEEVQWG